MKKKKITKKKKQQRKILQIQPIMNRRIESNKIKKNLKNKPLLNNKN